MALINTQVGPQVLTDGANPVTRSGRSGEVSVADAHARFMEPTYRGKLFGLDSDTVTIAAANATKGALATVKLINGFANPLNSGVLAVIVGVASGTTSGTPGGVLLYNFLTGISVTSAVTGTVRAMNLGGSSSAMSAQVNVVLTVAGGATTALIQLGVHGGPAAIAAGAGINSVYDPVDGKIIVPPGSVFGLTATATGTSHVVQSTIWWEEIPV